MPKKSRARLKMERLVKQAHAEGFPKKYDSLGDRLRAMDEVDFPTSLDDPDEAVRKLQTLAEEDDEW